MFEQRKRIILGLLFLSWFIGYFDRIAISVAAIPIGKELDLNTKQIGMIMSSFFVSYSIMQLVAGWLADKYGPKKLLPVSVLLWSFFTSLTGMTWSFMSLLATRFIFGIGEGVFPSASSVLVANMFNQEERARAKSLLLSSVGLGTAVGLGMATLINVLGWRRIFFILGLLGIVMVILLWKYLERCDFDEKIFNLKARIPFVKLIKTSLIWKLTLIWFGSSIVTWGMLSWMPSYWVNVKHLSMASMGMVMVFPSLGLFFSLNFGRWILDKYLTGKEQYLLYFGAGTTAVNLYLMFNATSISVCAFYMTVAMIANGLIGATIFALPLKYLPREIIGSATGIINSGGQTAGMVAPTMMGFLIFTFKGSYDVAFYFLIICVSISLSISLSLKNLR